MKSPELCYKFDIFNFSMFGKKSFNEYKMKYDKLIFRYKCLFICIRFVFELTFSVCQICFDTSIRISFYKILAMIEVKFI